MKRIVLALALMAGLMTMAGTALAAAPAKPGPPLPGSLTTASCTTAGQVVTSGKAVYSFKGKVKVTLTTYTEGGFNNFGEPTTATFTTPVEPRFDKVVVTLVCRAPTTDVDGDGVFADDDCPNEAGPASNNGCPLPNTDFDNDGIDNLIDDCPKDAGRSVPEHKGTGTVVLRRLFQ